MTVNELIGKIATRARELADYKMDRLRLEYPAETDTCSELIRICRDHRLTRGEIIEAVIVDECSLEFDKSIPE